ncbi:MAG: hypothetical protein OCC49_17610 [Fibrobacterales bacterium]
MNKIIIAYFFVLIGCSSTGVVSMGQGSYLVSKKSPQVGFGPSVTLKADVYKEANEFCMKQNKEVETVNFESTDSGFAQSPTASLEFRCSEKND